MPQLLTSISDQRPCGEDLSFSAEFDLIQELRRHDDPTIDQGAWITALKQADWPAVAAQCDALLATRTKDLRLLVWRIEALSEVEGYAGLARGLSDCAQACELFWEGIYPLPEDGNLEQRAGSVRWLLTQLQRMAKALPVTASPSGRFTLLDLDQARQAADGNDREGSRLSANGQARPTTALITRAVSDTSAQFLRDTVASLAVAVEQLERLQTWLDPRLGDESPSFVHARQALKDAHHATQRLARDNGAIQAGDLASTTDASALSASHVAFGEEPTFGGAGSAEHGRAHALRQLREVAEFFRRTEPHSPVGMLVDKAVRWGEMPLHAWLREVVKDPSSLSHLEELLGVQPPAAAR